MSFMTLITAMVLCARSQDSYCQCQCVGLSVYVRRVHVVISNAGFKGGGKPRPTTRETAALQRGIEKALRT